jgi:hypothetical protein
MVVEIASATEYEGVGNFAEVGEDVQLGGVGGMAVNVSGTGAPEEVPPGALYAATKGSPSSAVRIARYSAEGKFELAWEAIGTEGEYERCGPKVPGEPSCSPQPGAVPAAIDVDVDQATGNVYVFRPQGALAVTVYSPDGSEVLSRFAATGSGKTLETPDVIHDSPYPGGLAVNDLGEVFVFDVNFADKFYHRLMVFKETTPGDPKTYAYVEGGDIGAGTIGEWPSQPAVDAAGNVYVAGFEGDYIQMYDPAEPSSPACNFGFPKGGITAYAVNRDTGEVFFYTYKDKRVHQLGSCLGGTFPEVGAAGGMEVTPPRNDLYAMAVNPSGAYPVSRPPGILYGGAPSATSSTGGEPGKTSLGYIFAPAEENPPVVGASAVLRVGERTAELRTTINPEGFQTHYAFQYLTRAGYLEGGETFEGASEAPPGGAIAGSGQAELKPTIQLGGLTPDTEYVYRGVARSNCSPGEPAKVCEVVGAIQGFRTFVPNAGELPDGRVHELVSPPRKAGGQVLPADPNSKSCPGVECKPGAGYGHFPMQSSPDGNAVVYEGTPFTSDNTAVIENEYISRRGPTGWTTVNLTPPRLESKAGQGYKAFDDGLNQGLLEQIIPVLSPEAPSGYTNLYLQSSAVPQSLSPLLTNANVFLHRLPGAGAGHLKMTYAGGSTDLSRLFFEANDLFTSESGEPGEKTNLYEWSAGLVRQVNLAPGDAETLPGAVLGSGRVLGSGGITIKVSVVSHAISSDGSRAFWTAEDGRSLVRVNGTETVEVPGPATCKSSLPLASRACFLTASADGSAVLLSNGRLYELNGETGAYEAGPDLSAGSGGFEGIAGQSEDLSHLYFVDSMVLTGGEENDHGGKAQVGKPNLYAWDEGATTFVATLAPTDNSSPGAWQAAPAVRTAEASPAGRFLAFTSAAPLTGYDNTGPCAPVTLQDAPCREVYLFDSATDRLTCPSCSPANARPLGQSGLRVILNVEGSLPQSRYLTDSGRLYFDSQDALVPVDTNGKAEDVYQYEPKGIGDCERDGGCVSLLSGGRELTDSNFLAIDATGDNVFFTTRDPLLPADTDELIDLYDARPQVGRPPPQGPQPPTSEPPSPPLPIEPSPASSTFVESGSPRPCGKGRVRRGGKCVKKTKHKKGGKRGNRAQRNREGAK